MRFFRSQPDRRFVAGLVLLMTLGIVAFWQAGGPSDRPPAQELDVAKLPFPLSVPEVKKADAAQTASFFPLRTTPEGLPAAIERLMRLPSYGTNWNLAQELPLGDEGRLWLIPGNGYLCALWLSPKRVLGQGCSPTRIAVARGVAVVSLSARPHPGRRGNRVMVGVAPGGASKVLVETGPQTKARPVRGSGVFVLHDAATDPPDILRFR